MNTKMYYWKVWLRENHLTKDVDNDYTAEVSTSKHTLRNEDIAQVILNEGSEIKYDTLVSILNQADRVIRECIIQGFSVMTGNVHFTPRVSGVWIGSAANYDPTIHRTTTDLVATKTLRDALSHINVEVLGTKDSTAFIGLVANATMDTTDNKFKPGDDLILTGDKMKIVGEEGDPVGIFFIDEDGVEHPVTRRPAQNGPKKIICRAPEGLEKGEFRVVIRTRYAGGSLLKDVRTLEYEQPLTYSEGL